MTSRWNEDVSHVLQSKIPASLRVGLVLEAVAVETVATVIAADDDQSQRRGLANRQNEQVPIKGLLKRLGNHPHHLLCPQGRHRQLPVVLLVQGAKAGNEEEDVCGAMTFKERLYGDVFVGPSRLDVT